MNTPKDYDHANNHKIVTEFNGNNYFELSQKYKLSMQYIYKILKANKKAPEPATEKIKVSGFNLGTAFFGAQYKKPSHPFVAIEVLDEAVGRALIPLVKAGLITIHPSPEFTALEAEAVWVSRMRRHMQPHFLADLLSAQYPLEKEIAIERQPASQVNSPTTHAHVPAQLKHASRPIRHWRVKRARVRQMRIQAQLTLPRWILI